MAELILNRPNWLGSEVGMVLKTFTLPGNFSTSTVVENGRTIAKSGAIVDTTNVKGLLYGDYDITDGDVIASCLIRGSYIDAKLPATASGSASAFKAQGLFAFAEGDVTRPDFGDNALGTLATVVPTATATAITWASVANAVGYEVADANYAPLVISTDLTYTATSTTATYYIRALADNIYYGHGDYGSATVTTWGK